MSDVEDNDDDDEIEVGIGAKVQVRRSTFSKYYDVGEIVHLYADGMHVKIKTAKYIRSKVPVEEVRAICSDYEEDSEEEEEEKKKETFACPDCSKVCASKAGLTRHRRTHFDKENASKNKHHIKIWDTRMPHVWSFGEAEIRF